MKKIFSLLLIMAMVFTIVPMGALAADSGGTWEIGTPMNIGRHDPGVVEVQGKIYAIGGRNSTNSWQYTVEMYDPASDTWEFKASMPKPKQNFALSVVNNKIYVIGGHIPDDGVGLDAVSTVEMYDPSTNTWTTKASMSTVRTYFSTAVVNDKIYAIGGYRDGLEPLSSVEMYDPDTNTWTTKASMSSNRTQFATAVIDNKIYAFGGYDQISLLDTIEVYDPQNNAWIISDTMQQAEYQLEATVLNDNVYIAQRSSKSILKYDPFKKLWSTIPSMNFARSQPGITVLNDKIYVVGGSDDIVEIYTPGSDVDAPLNLTATGGDAKVMLNWNEVTDADTYNVYRSLTSGGPYTSVATNVYGTSYVDSPLTNGTTYYYVVTAVNENGESAYSNEASATPQSDDNNRAILTIILNSGLVKEYDVSMSEVNTFMTWYESKSSLFYKFDKDYNLGSDISRTDYVVHDMIELFEVREYKVSE
ncbi:Kelch repeat-containing protein [Longirhabdus pacifica]|uniref:Kelch repeat-containing protein n=1 Tax=Longirhabdus pacifica TaxID=2305227 RepID=UPI001008E808|nr:kelch repeat-containing protein [Longirhabdus pacifica]